MNVNHALRLATCELPRRVGLPEPLREARWLLARLLGCSESWLLAHSDDDLNTATQETYFAWVGRRAAGEPAHYIVGKCDFFGRSFTVTPAVLIPRPETELLIEQALSLPLIPRARVLDVGTGSGCIAITIALEKTDARVVGVDLSLAALAVSRANALGLGASVKWLVTDLTLGLVSGFDLVVANLPYVPLTEVANLAIEISDHEPAHALFAGADGADLLRLLVLQLPNVLSKQGYAILEMGPGQLALLSDVIEQSELKVAAAGRDINDVERVITLGRRSR